MARRGVGVTRLAASVCALVAACSAGCGNGIAEMRPLFVPAAHAHESPAGCFSRAMSAALALGYHPAPVQARRFRFGVRAHDLYGQPHWEAAIAVECGRNGVIRLTPIGPRVELFEGRYLLPLGLRDELLALARALGPPRPSPSPYAADLPSE